MQIAQSGWLVGGDAQETNGQIKTLFDWATLALTGIAVFSELALLVPWCDQGLM